MQGDSQIININKIQKAIINRQNAGKSIGEKQIIVENEHNIIEIIPIMKLIRIVIKISIRKIKKDKTEINRKKIEFPSITYRVKRHPNIPQI